MQNVGAIAQGRFRWCGRMTTPGERIPPAEIAKAGPVVTKALADQRLLVLDGSPADLLERIQQLQASVDVLRERLDRLDGGRPAPSQRKPRAAKPKEA